MVDVLGVEPDPDPRIQGLFWVAVGLPDCQGWAWGFEEEEGPFALKEDPEDAAKNTEYKLY